MERAHRTRSVVSTLEMVRQEHRIVLTVVREPCACESVSYFPVVFGEHRIGALPQERVSERELRLPREAALRAPHDDLPLEQLVQPGLQSHRTERVAEE